jgi:hypothetical protein
MYITPQHQQEHQQPNNFESVPPNYMPHSQIEQQSQQQYIQPHPQSSPVQLTLEEQEQLKHLQKYAHILQRPFFPLYCDSDADEIRKQEEMHQEILAAIEPQPQVPMHQKIALHALGLATGTEFLNMDKMVNNMVKGSALIMGFANAIGSAQNLLVSVSRWAAPPGSPCQIVVDFMECAKITDPMAKRPAYVKVSYDTKVNVAGKVMKLKRKGKDYLTVKQGPLGDVAVLDKDKVEHALVMVMRIQRQLSPYEYASGVLPRWRKRWTVPE